MTQFRIPFRNLVALVLLLVGGLFLSGCDAAGAPETPSEQAVSVRVSGVTGGQAQEITLRFSGIVRSTQRATLTFQVGGALKERAVELGEKVAAGDVLARVYNPALEPARDSAGARLDELNTQYDQAKREWERSTRLRKSGVISEQNLEQIAASRDALKASVATARAELVEASQMLQESLLRAPFAGRVEALLVEKDEFVAAGQPVIRLSSTKGKEVEIRVPAYLLAHVSVGQEVPVWSVQNRNDAPVIGSVVEIAQAGAIRGELHSILVSLPVKTLEPGEPVEVGITPIHQSAITVPLLSVVRNAGGITVFRVRNGVARRVPIDVERVVGERVVVRAGELKPGDQVVYAGITRLVDGDAVEVR
ncbi:efflux RND transporter periplasmic adaptor subunit [Marinobacter antarcticus]|uniref:Efflux RND transporter periplasmic adaptor subunit n=3 Tax=root TaxID=1 RepID=A0A831VUB1_9GAMM|nr:efflux RND transporter periplasmic adaptor subunit [Marinobacter antarcticus]HEA51478.1 efflux RND transporter periplasmic adaptor subunit [Marinobacter antarcticus]